MNEPSRAGLIRELARQFQGLVEPRLRDGALPAQSFGSLAHELRGAIQIEAALAELAAQRRLARTPADSTASPDEVLQLCVLDFARRWRAMGESFRRLQLQALAGICVQLERSWRNPSSFDSHDEEAWRCEARKFAQDLYALMHRLAHGPISA